MQHTINYIIYKFTNYLLLLLLLLAFSLSLINFSCSSIKFSTICPTLIYDFALPTATGAVIMQAGCFELQYCPDPCTFRASIRI